MWGRPSRGAAISVPLPPPRSGQCNTQMDEFPIHPPLAGSPGGADKCENPKLASKPSLTSLWFVHWCVCGGLTSWPGVEHLNAIAGCQSLLQQRGELLWELLPVLLPNLLLKTMQYLRDEAEDGGQKSNQPKGFCPFGVFFFFFYKCGRQLSSRQTWLEALPSLWLLAAGPIPDMKQWKTTPVSHWAPHLVEHVS